MSEALLVLNAGSSSIKFALFPLAAEIDRKPALSGQIDNIAASADARLDAHDDAGTELEHRILGDCRNHHQAIEFLLDWIDAHTPMRVRAVGHRVVHGGEKFSAPLRIDAQALETLETFIPLAPLHQPHNLDPIRVLRQLQPQLPQVACFDTAFHRSQAPLTQLFALPRRLTAQGVRRYGFHGLSYEYIAHVLPEHLGAAASGRVIVAHLGNGASMCALRERQSVASSMGFTALDGLMMGTRCGNLDPGVLLYLLDHEGMNAAQLSRLLYQESGLLGVSGFSRDMRELLASERPEAREAVDLFCYRIQRELGSLAASIGGLDALVFTGGIGEHAAAVRAQVCAGAAWLGVSIDAAANAAAATCLSTATSAVKVLILPTNEEWIIARHTAAQLAFLAHPAS